MGDSPNQNETHMEVPSLISDLKGLKESSRRLDVLRVLVPRLTKSLTSSDCVLVLEQFNRDNCVDALRVLTPYLKRPLGIYCLMEILVKFDHEYRLDVLRSVFSNRSIPLTVSEFFLISQELKKADRVDGFYVMYSSLQGPFSMTDVLIMLINFQMEERCVKVMEKLFTADLFKPSSDCLVQLVDSAVLSPVYLSVYGFMVGKLESVETQVVNDVLAKLKHQSQKLSVLAMTAPKMTRLKVRDAISLLEYFSIDNEHEALVHIIDKVYKMSKTEFLSVKGMVNDKCKKLLETRVASESALEALEALEALRCVGDKHKLGVVALLVKDGVDTSVLTEETLAKNFGTEEDLVACKKLLDLESKRVYKNPTIHVVDSIIEKSSLEKADTKRVGYIERRLFIKVTHLSDYIDVDVKYRGSRIMARCPLDSYIAVDKGGDILVDGITIYHYHHC